MMDIKHIKKLMPQGYQYIDLTAKDLLACCKVFKELKPNVKDFSFPPEYKISNQLLCLSGTVPVNIKGKTYHIPVCIYLRKDYPCYPPYCYVMPTAGMSLVMSRNLDGKGMVYLPYLSDWKKDKCNLHNLVQVLIVTFTEECPVYSHRNRSSNQQHAHQLLNAPSTSCQSVAMLNKQPEEIIQSTERIKDQQPRAVQESQQYTNANSVELQQQLNTQKEMIQMLQNKCNFLENTVISGLVERLEAVEVAVQAVERLWVVSRDEVYLSSNILGTGGWGFVKEATYRGRKVAAKCLHSEIVSDHNQKQFEKEIKISARCRHQNLVEFIGAVPDHPAIILIEVMDTNLRDALTSRRVTPNHLHPVSVDVARGLSYLHGIQPQPIIHRDVSAPNVLLKAVGTGWIAKLSDLGSAQFAHIAHTVAPGCVLYAAPEVRQEVSAAKQTEKLDVYSYGVLLIEMLTREMPTGNIEALVDSLKPKWPRFVPLILNCTKIDPNLRPSMKNVIDQLDTITI